MTRNELLKCCHFFNGDDNRPIILDIIEGMPAMYWDYERTWVNWELNQDEDYKGYIIYFQRNIVKDKTLKKEIPIGLQAIFANRLEHWGGRITSFEAVNQFINEYLYHAEE